MSFFSNSRDFAPGDAVIYEKSKVSTLPGPRARNVIPSQKGETYSYLVDKYWVVLETDGENLLLGTRQGKRHSIRKDDRNLRHPHWWEKILYRHRFPKLQATKPEHLHTPH